MTKNYKVVKLLLTISLCYFVKYAEGNYDSIKTVLEDRILESLVDEYLDELKENHDILEEIQYDNDVGKQDANLILDVTLHKIHISNDDTYLCRTFKVDNPKTLYITGYKPRRTKDIAHHMLLYGCLRPGYTNQTLWDCEGEMSEASSNSNADDLGGSSTLPKGPVCAEGDSILYAWGNEAPALKLPPGVGFEVGSNTNVKYLTLQVHIRTKKKANELGVKGTGLSVMATTTAKPNIAGIYVLASEIGSILPHTTVNMDIVCRYNSRIPMHPFAFRTHTHKLGVEVLGYRVRNEKWTLLGDKNPQLPQAFYSIRNNNIEIKKGDWLAARCIMHNFRDRTTVLGPKHTDEMCNFYIMYYTPKSFLKNKSLGLRQCNNGFPWTHWQNYFYSVPSNMMK